MAVTIGKSGAWKAILTALESKGLFVDHPHQLPVLLETCKQQYEQTFERAQRDIEREIQEGMEEIQRDKANLDLHIRQEVAQLHDAIQHLEQTRLVHKDSGLFQRLLNYRATRQVERELHVLRQALQNCPEQVKERIERKEHALIRKQAMKTQLIQERCRAAGEAVVLLEDIVGFPELAGAVAELNMLAQLEMLPHGYYILNDVLLGAHRRIRYDGAGLHTAQVDHLVVAPTGIFVIEVKHWSKRFAESGAFFDPYQQVERAAYLCYDTFRYRFPRVKVRSVLAYDGHLPSDGGHQYVKILRIPNVVGYIRWFREPIFDEDMVRDIVDYLTPYSS